MVNDGLISIVIPQEVIETVTNAINVIATQLKPYLISLKPEQRKALLKMGDKTIPFVSKVIEYCKTNPEFIPAYLDLDELSADYLADTVVTGMWIPVRETDDNLNDTRLMLGSDCYKAALKYYDSVKIAAKNNVPNAKTVYEDLRKRFENQGRKAEEESSTNQ